MKIKELRKKMGLKQVELASKLGITPANLCRYENGVNEPSVDMLLKLADIFCCSIDEILGANTPMLDLRRLDDSQKELIEQGLKLNPAKLERVLGYIKSLNE